ncbi:MAG: hypothetical protein VX642_00500 [Bdellovibrionota bacterium]|nr:hypothetical protein [Bdellovibrionota bacterium]
MGKAFLIFIFSLNLFAGFDPDDNSLIRSAQKICGEDPESQLAVVLTKFITKAEDQRRPGSRIKPKDKIRWKYSTQKVELKNLESRTHYVGKYFRILEADTENVIALDCENLRASNVYFHLNYIHEMFEQKMLPYFPKDVKEKLEKHYPIDIRINMEKDYSFTNRFSEKEKMHNYVTTTCGYLEKTDKYRFKEKPEILFYKPNWKRGKLGFAPICWIPELKNEIPCAKDSESVAMDLSLIPANIFHEYIHLLTDSYMNECRTNMLAESYSIFSSIVMSPLKEAGTRLPGMVNNRYNEAEFEKEFERYSPEVENETKLWLEEKGDFAYQFMGKVYHKLIKKLKLSHIQAWRFVLSSSFEVRSINGNRTPKVLDLPTALKKQCGTSFPKKLKDCREIINQLEKKYY